MTSSGAVSYTHLPQRYTYEFVESADGFALCFFPEKYRKELQYCGTISGRDEDKICLLYTSRCV